MSDDVDEFLAHYGVLGMKWGHRSAASPQVAAAKARKKAAYQNEVQGARDKLKNEVNPALRAAKKQYKQDSRSARAQYLQGKSAAKKALNKVKDEKWETSLTASQYKNGKEVAKDVLVSVGEVAVTAAILGTLHYAIKNG